MTPMTATFTDTILMVFILAKKIGKLPQTQGPKRLIMVMDPTLI
jgi:hypothetical protein